MGARLRIVIVAACVCGAIAPRGRTTLELESAAGPSGTPISEVAAATAAAAAAAAAVWMSGKVLSPSVPPHLRCGSRASRSGDPIKSGDAVASPVGAFEGTNDVPSDVPSDEDDGDDDNNHGSGLFEDYVDVGDMEEDAEQPDAPGKSVRRPQRKLWTNLQFPEGVKGASNYDFANLTAAQEWSCPCLDRDCIGADRLKLAALYEHRKDFRTKAAAKGGLRDANRLEMQGHYDQQSGTFTRSFVVGPLGDCCAASAGLANGLSFDTWASSRADVTLQRPWHAGRCEAKSKQQSEERAHLEAYIRELRSTCEGPKGGSDPKDKWHAPKMCAHHSHIPHPLPAHSSHSTVQISSEQVAAQAMGRVRKDAEAA